MPSQLTSQLGLTVSMVPSLRSYFGLSAAVQWDPRRSELWSEGQRSEPIAVPGHQRHHRRTAGPLE